MGEGGEDVRRVRRDQLTTIEGGVEADRVTIAQHCTPRHGVAIVHVLDSDNPCTGRAPEQRMRAMNKGELVLLYQPKVECGSRRIVGAEAVAAWQHPQWGLIAPVDFVGLAVNQERIHQIGRWEVDRACAQLSEWHRAGNADWTIAVDISSVQLQHPDFCGNVRDALRQNGIAADKLILDVAESCLMQQSDVCRNALLDLFADGVQIALEGFGNRVTSLARLKRLPINELKIDPVFVADVDRNTVDSEIVSSIVTLGAILGLRVVAEGVERLEQFRAVEMLVCDQTQGLLHAPAISGDEFLLRFGLQKHAGAAVAPSGTKEVAFG